MKLHHKNVQNEYNYRMNKVDIDDKHRSCYIMDHQKRCFKCCLDLWLWGLEGFGENVSIAYIKMCVIIYNMKKRKSGHIKSSKSGWIWD